MGNQLSGGEQQMLAIGRALMTNPKLLILDEATEGLAPLIRAEIWACLARLKGEGQAILLIDKHLDALLKLADRHVVIEKGRVVWTGTSAALAADPERARALFAGVGLRCGRKPQVLQIRSMAIRPFYRLAQNDKLLLATPASRAKVERGRTICHDRPRFLSKKAEKRQIRAAGENGERGLECGRLGCSLAC